ncbi:MAG: glycerol-3-phosphate dehydrogenase C-terminal domain-containing protein [Paludibaculum sp.]
MARNHPERGVRLHAALPYLESEVIWAARWEMARTVEDVLARRTRALLLNARAAMDMAPRVAELLAGELGMDVGVATNPGGLVRGHGPAVSARVIFVTLNLQAQ